SASLVRYITAMLFLIIISDAYQPRSQTALKVFTRSTRLLHPISIRLALDCYLGGRAADCDLIGFRDLIWEKQCRTWCATGSGWIHSWAQSQGCLTVITLSWHNWIEVVFEMDPDQGTGSAEWLVVAALVTTTIVLAVAACLEWHRPRIPSHEGGARDCR